MKKIQPLSENERNILSRIPCGILVLNELNQIIYVNKQLLELTQMSSEMILSKDIALLGPLFDHTHNSTFRKQLDEWAENTTLQVQTKINKGNASLTPVFINGKRSRNTTGELNFYLSILDLSNLDDWAEKKDPLPSYRDHFHGLFGKAPHMQELYNLIEMASGTGANVIIQGESGTGKELVASAVHYASNRSTHPFVRVNCAALAETLLESELFGHIKGAFTGAYRDRKGNFETAHKGTILLDEIGEISPMMQAKLLRVLQERVIVRVGDNHEIQVDVRIIAATNKNLRALVKKGAFREDLFYRLNVFPIHVPSLGEKKSDIPLLCTHFLEKYRTDTGKYITAVSADAMRLFMAYCWPGNIRELENTIEHAFVLCQTDTIEVTDLPHELRVKVVREGICAEKTAGIAPRFTAIPVLPKRSTGRLNITKEQLESELAKHHGNKSATARALGISNVGLWKKMKKMGMG